MFLQANPKAKVADPIPGMIVAINMYLQAYHMYRAAALNKPEVKSLRLDTMSRDALDTLQKEFPFGVRRADGYRQRGENQEKDSLTAHCGRQ